MENMPLKINYIAFDTDYNTSEEVIVLDDNFEVPTIAALKLFLADFIKYWKSYHMVEVVYTQEVTEVGDFPVPTQIEILIALSKMKKYEGLKKYGIDKSVCPICSRKIPKKQESKHHLIPCAEGGGRGPKVTIHRICHSKIHSVLTEEELALKYNTVEIIKEHEAIQKFIKWVKNKPDNFYDSSKRKKSKLDKKYKSDMI